MTNRFIICILIILVTLPPTLYGQAAGSLKEAEEKLNGLFDEIAGDMKDETRIEQGELFSREFHQALKINGSFDYPFDSLTRISTVVSPDGYLKLYTWNIPRLAGTNNFYGFLQIRGTDPDSNRIIRLHDESVEIENAEDAILTPNRWYGAIYYRIIPEQTHSGGTVYTLLGWHGDDLLVSSRIIEVLTVNTSGEILFGKALFCGYGEKRPLRIIFRYSARSTMILRYEKQYIVTSKRWNARKREFEYTREKALLIVCDRLVPADPQLEGQYEYYIPAGEVIDGFVFSDGCWNFIEDVDVRNPKPD